MFFLMFLIKKDLANKDKNVNLNLNFRSFNIYVMVNIEWNMLIIYKYLELCGKLKASGPPELYFTNLNIDLILIF